MKIAHFVESFSPLSETFIYNKILGLEARGVSNYIYTTKLVKRDRSFKNIILLQKRKTHLLDSLVYRFTSYFGDKRKLQWHDINLFCESLEANLKSNMPDIIYAHFGPLVVACLPIAQKLDIPVLGQFYGYDMSKNLKSKFWIKAYSEYLNGVSAAIGISKFICDKMEKFINKDKINLVYLGVPLSTNTSIKPPSNIITFTFIGRFVEKKSPVELLKSFSHFKKIAGPNFLSHLHMIGDGPLMEASLNLTERLGIGSSVTFHGALSHNNAMNILQGSDVYVQHSITAKDGDMEGQGVTLVEAGLFSIPIIATDHNGFSDIVKEGVTGYLVPEKDIELMGQRMYELANDKDLRSHLGINGRKFIENYFSLEKEIDNTLRIINKILESDNRIC